MFTSERHQEIIRTLQKEGKVKVKDLSEIFAVSEDCIRKDLKHLEMQGKCKRAYGGAIISDAGIEHSVYSRKNLDLKSKHEVAQKIYELIQEGETIFLDISTTNLLVAKLLANGEKQCIVISNMIEILQILSKNKKITTIGTGGNVNLELNGFVGALALNVVSRHFFDRAFVGTTGIDYETMQMTTFDIDDGLIKECALINAKNKYLVMEAKKFEKCGTYKFGSIEMIDFIVTNDKVDAKVKSILKKHKVKYI